MLELHAQKNLLLVSLTVCHSALTLRNLYVFRIDTVSAKLHLLVDTVYAKCDLVGAKIYKKNLK